MKARDRYLTTVRGEAVGFLPRTPILMQYAAEHIGSGYRSRARPCCSAFVVLVRCAF